MLDLESTDKNVVSWSMFCTAVFFAVLFLTFSLAGISLARSTEFAGDDYNTCLVRELQAADDNITVGQIKKRCEMENTAADSGDNDPAATEKTALERRMKQEYESSSNLWTITPHKQNYILLGAYNFSDPYEQPWEESASTDLDLNKTEVKFQVSFKFMLWENIFKKKNNGNLYFAYTQLALWQLYNRDISSPFRDTNYEPEAFVAFNTDWDFFGFKNRFFILGVSHQSNGREDPLSRSWNRIYANFIMERGNLVLSLKPWYRLPEAVNDDDNPDIEDYLGYGEMRAVYRTGDNTFTLMLRNNLKPVDENRGAVQLDWSFPLPGTDRIKGFVQYFNGYGECLLDYNASTSRLGLGFLLTDYL